MLDEQADADTEAAVGRWVDANWGLDLTLRRWWQLLADERLAFPTWPEPWGRRWSPAQVRARDRALRRRGALGPPTGLGVLMGAPVVADHGTDEQRRRWLPALAAGVESWCQLFSEPGAGSDLAAVATRAVRDGDQWVVTGQKVWTSGGAITERGMLLARVDTSAPKHRGLGWFVLPMDQPGVEVRPLVQMNGASHFSEVFLDEARVDDADLVGAPGDGWALARATLAHERAGLGSGGGDLRPTAGERGGMLDRTVGDLIDELSRRRVVAEDAAGSEASLRALLDAHPEASAVVVDQVASLIARERMAGWSAQRGRALARSGGDPSATSSVAKLAWTERLRPARDVGLGLLGPAGMLDGASAPDGGAMARFACSVPAASIAGGTDEIQRNIIGERVLGLPREPEPDRDGPFHGGAGGGAGR